MLGLKFLRLASGRTQWGLSREAGISQGRFSMLERGLVEPTYAEQEALSQILGTPVPSLFQTAAQSILPRVLQEIAEKCQTVEKEAI